jgi:hypothetical protein
LRSQVRAAMIFNGHTSDDIDKIDEETYAEICVMYSDGVLGNKAIYDALTPITTGVFNYIRGQNQPAYKSTQIFPWIVEYSQNPDYEPTEQDKVSNSLLTYMTQAPGFNIKKVKNGGGI